MPDPEFARMEALSQRYARFSTRGGGLDWLAGGLLLTLMGGIFTAWAQMAFLRYGAPWTWAAFQHVFPRKIGQPLPAAILALALVLPLLWLALRKALRWDLHRRFGWAEERVTEKVRSRTRKLQRSDLLLLPGYAFFFWEAGKPWPFEGVALALLAVYVLAVWRTRGEVDRILTGSIFFLGALAWGTGGSGYLVGISLVMGFSGLGLALAGAIQHFRFRALVRNLETRP